MKRGGHIFQYGEITEKRIELKGPAYSQRGNLMRLFISYVFAVKQNLTPGRRKDSGDQVERVDFPAPFGPISPTTSPFSTDTSKSDTAVRPPNCLVSPLISRSMNPFCLSSVQGRSVSYPEAASSACPAVLVVRLNITPPPPCPCPGPLEILQRQSRRPPGHR